MRWKVYGPDLNGRFGGLQGTGGLEAVILDADGTTTGVINDQFGNGVASVSGGSVTWYTTRVGAYGPLPGIQAQTLTDVSQVAASTAWRSRRMDPTGFYWLGARYYEPTSGRFLSADPMGQAASPSLYDFAGGDPVNFFDPTGRCKNDPNNPDQANQPTWWDRTKETFSQWIDRTFGVGRRLDNVADFFNAYPENGYMPDPRSQAPHLYDPNNPLGEPDHNNVWESPGSTFKRGLLYDAVNASGVPTKPDGSPISPQAPKSLNGEYPANPDPAYPAGGNTDIDAVNAATELRTVARLAGDALAGNGEAVMNLRKFTVTTDPQTGQWMLTDISNPSKRPVYIPEGQARQILSSIYESWDKPVPKGVNGSPPSHP